MPPSSPKDPPTPHRNPDPVVPRGWNTRPERLADGPPEPPRNEPARPRQYFVPADTSSLADAPGSPSYREQPGSAPAAQPKRPKKTKRRRWSPGRVAWIAALTLLALVLLVLVYGLWQFQRIDKVAVGNVLSAGGSGTNYLIVGSDSREGFDPNDPNAGAVLGPGADADAGQRSDTMLVLRTSSDGSVMTSIPRDLFVTRSDGSQGRINSAYRDGPVALIQTIQQGIGIPVHHYVEVDFVTFAGLVNAVGGVTIDLPHPARDTHSGLDLPQAGPAKLDGVQALAYVRSRQYQELVDGSWVGDPTGDLGRVQRQQIFLRAVMSEVGGTRNPLELMRVSSAVAGGLRIDDSMSFFDALRFARSLRGMQPESIPLPTYPFRAAGGAAVLGLVEPDAGAVIERFK